MSDNIFGDRFMGFREPAWHHLGQVFDEPITATQACERSGADIPYTTHPLIVADFPDLEVKQVAIIRHPVPDDNQYRVMGYASPDYTVLQNMDIAKILDPLTDEWPVETIGVLSMGSAIFFTLDAGTTTIGGEDVKQFFLVSDYKTGKDSLRIAYTPTRVVCWNTLISGLSAATVTSSIPHSRRVKDELDFRVQLMSQMRKSQQQVNERMQLLTKQRIVAEQVAEIIETAYPLPRRPRTLAMMDDIGDAVNMLAEKQQKFLQRMDSKAEYERDRIIGFRDLATQAYLRLNDEYPKIAETPWAAYNAVVECEDYRIGKDKDIFESTLFGKRAAVKVRAFDSAFAISQN